MAEDITVEQVIKKLKQHTEEWVNTDIEKGIALPFRYLQGGRYKVFLLFALWRNVFVPLLLGLLVMFFAINKYWNIFWIALGLYIIYWVVGLLFHRRERGNFIVKKDGITIVTNRNKMFIPWDAIKEIGYTYCDKDKAFENIEDIPDYGSAKFPGRYNLFIQTITKKYEFYEIYAKTLIVDSDNRVNPGMISLHISYNVLEAAKEKYINN